MALAIDVELLTGTYEAALDDRDCEWPPHPGRLFCALVAVAGSPDDDAALRWLERLGPPAVVASEATAARSRAFVPTNAISRETRSQQYLARTNGQRSWPRAMPAIPRVRFEWPTVEPSDDELTRLDELARRVSYLGRPSGFVVLRVHRDPPPFPPVAARYVPVRDGDLLLRTPYPGYLDALRGAFEADQPADSVSRPAAYVRTTGESAAGTEAETGTHGPFSRLLTLGFPPGTGLDGWHSVRLTTAWRAAVLQRLGKPEPGDPWRMFSPEELEPIHGHLSDRRYPPRRRCSFVALPFVGHAHATGEVLGLGIALGADLAHELRRALLQLFGFDRLDGPRIDRIRVPDLGLTLPLAPPDGRWALEPGRWIGPARRWASALPVVLDWFPKRDRGFEEIVRQGIVVAGYPEPAAIELRPASAVPGAPFLRRHDRKRRAAEPVRPWAHLVVEFGVDLTGPVLLGHMRHLGLGLCAPLPNGDE